MKNKPLSKEDLIQKIESRLQEPGVPLREFTSLTKRLANLRGWVKQGEYVRKVATQESQPESKPLPPPPTPVLTPEEAEVEARCSAKWDEWSKQHPQESRDFLIADLYERHNMFGPEKWAEMRAGAEAKWKECWAEYDAYYQQQTSHSFFGSK